MSVMIFQAGGDTKIWGRKLKTKTVDPDDVAVHLANGWYKHPADDAVRLRFCAILCAVSVRM
jgi:hypothetical protein